MENKMPPGKLCYIVRYTLSNSFDIDEFLCQIEGMKFPCDGELPPQFRFFEACFDDSGNRVLKLITYSFFDSVFSYQQEIRRLERLDETDHRSYFDESHLFAVSLLDP